MSHFFCYGGIAERLLTMNGPEILRIVDAIHRDKSIDMEIVFEGIEQAILSAARKHFSEEEELIVQVDRITGEPSLTCDGAQLDSDLLGDLLGRISAQTAKQVMIQKIREAERDAHYDEFLDLKSQIVSGSVTRVDRRPPASDPSGAGRGSIVEVRDVKKVFLTWTAVRGNWGLAPGPAPRGPRRHHRSKLGAPARVPQCPPRRSSPHPA